MSGEGKCTCPQTESTATNRSQMSAIWASPEWKQFLADNIKPDSVCEQCGKKEGDIAINKDGEPYTVHLTIDHPFRWAYKSKELYLDFEASMCRIVCRTCNSSFERGLDICPVCKKHYKPMREPMCRECYFEKYPQAREAYEAGKRDQKNRQRARKVKREFKKNPHPCGRHSKQSINCLWPGYGACDQNRKNAPKNKCGHYKPRKEGASA